MVIAKCWRRHQERTSMKKQITTIATLLVFLTISLTLPLKLDAQELSEQYSSEKLAKLNPGNKADKASLRALLANFTNLKATFNQTITDLQGQELQSSKGELLLQKPQQIRWITESPEESILVADGKTVFNVDPFVEQVTLLDQSTLTKSNPLMLLITDQESQWVQVAVTKENNAFTVISLAVDSPITKLILNFGKDNKLLSIVSIDRQQQQNKVAFTNVAYNTPTNKEDFSYTPKPSWVIDDQREQAIN